MNNDIIIKVYRRTLLLSLFIIGCSFFLFKEPKAAVLGYIFGTLIAMLTFKLLDISIQKSVKMNSRQASMYSTGQYFIRYFIYGLVMTISAKADYLNLGTTILGLLSIKIVIISSSIFKKSL